jgi:hypothetical protein
MLAQEAQALNEEDQKILHHMNVQDEVDRYNRIPRHLPPKSMKHNSVKK